MMVWMNILLASSHSPTFTFSYDGLIINMQIILMKETESNRQMIQNYYNFIYNM